MTTTRSRKEYMTGCEVLRGIAEGWGVGAQHRLCADAATVTGRINKSRISAAQHSSMHLCVTQASYNLRNFEDIDCVSVPA
jgi:hypothetical protein